jgi:hypothetical protein
MNIFETTNERMYEEVYFLTSPEARAYGENFEDTWHWLFDPQYRVYYDATDETWVCYTSRYIEPLEMNV